MIRKLIIAVSAILVVLAAFVIYNNIVDTAPIVPQESFQDDDPIEIPVFNTRAEIAGNLIGNAGKSSFVTTDPITRKPVRIFGFEKLLNPEDNSDKWRLKNPYMEFFGKGFNCKVRAKQGNAQIETVLGKPSPQNAQLHDDVRIEITFDNEGSKSVGVIYLEDMDYDSERSEISTNNSVRAEFAEATMVGKGMVLIYNTAEARIEFFELIDLDYIKVKNVGNLSQNDDAEEEKEKEEETSSVAKTETAAENAVQVNGNAAAKDAVSITEVRQAGTKDNLYQCRFRKDVTIEYADELVVVGRTSININNILFNSSQKKSKADTETPAQTVNAETAEKTESAETEVALNSDVSDSEETVAAAADSKEVMITCNGGFIIEPMDNVMIKDEAKKAGTIELSRLEAGLNNPVLPNYDVHGQDLPAAEISPDFQLPELQPKYAYLAADESTRKPTRFHAERIDYDMTTGNAFAKGPIRLLIYNASAAAESPSKTQIPINITATENVEYFSEKNQAVFNGDVVGTRIERQVDSVTQNTLYGDKLIVDLKSSDAASGGGDSIRHLTVLGEEVILDSEKKSGDKTLNITKLFCDRLDYNSDMELLTATGPGKIEIDNANAPVEEGKSAGDMSLGGPCYAWIENFEFLEWSTSTNRVVADSASKSLILQYVPLVEGKPGKAVYAVTSRIEADFMQTFDGRTELAMLTAKNGITFNEEDGNAFEGDRLYYSVNNSILQINGTKDELCKVNGMPTEKIRYDLKTRELITRIAGAGTFSTGSKE